jgi:hypothetical protein
MKIRCFPGLEWQKWKWTEAALGGVVLGTTGRATPTKKQKAGFGSPVVPENLKPLKSLTLMLAMITLERWGFPYPLTSRDKVSDHATRLLDPADIRLGLVPITLVDADRTHCSASPSGGLSTKHLTIQAPAHRSIALGLAVSPVARLAGCPEVRPTTDRHGLAEETH